MRLGFVVLVVLCPSLVQAESFNFEVAKRTFDVVQGFLAQPDFPSRQTVNSFAKGYVTASAQNQDTFRLLEFSLIRSVASWFPQLYNGFEDGMLFGFYNNNSLVSGSYAFTFSANSNATCGDVTQCRTDWATDMDANTLHVIRNVSYDARTKGWYISAKLEQKPTWGSVFPLESNSLGMTFTSPIQNTAGDFIGVNAADFDLTAVEDFLVSALAAPDRVVFIEEANTGLMIAASIRGISTYFDQNGTVAQRRSSECTNQMVREASAFLRSFTAQDAVLYVHEGLYIQATSFTAAPGIAWSIIVVQPASSVGDFVGLDSATGLMMFLFGAVGCLVSLIFLGTVVKFGFEIGWDCTTRAWYPALVIANLACSSSIFILVGENNWRCEARMWWVGIGVASMACALCARSITAWWTATPTQNTDSILVLPPVSTAATIAAAPPLSAPPPEIILPRTSLPQPGFQGFCHRYLLMGVFAVCELISIATLVVWATVAPLTSHANTQSVSGVMVEKQICGLGNLSGLLVFVIWLLVLGVAGLLAAFATRRKNKALVLVFYHGAVMCALLLAVSLGTSVTSFSLAVLIGFSLFWFGISTLAALSRPVIQHWLVVAKRMSNAVPTPTLAHRSTKQPIPVFAISEPSELHKSMEPASAVADDPSAQVDVATLPDCRNAL